MITVVKEDAAGLDADYVFNADLFAAGEAAPGSFSAGGVREPGGAAVRLAARRALLKAEESGLNSIVFTVPKTGAGWLNPEALAKAMVSEARSFTARAQSIENVIFSAGDGAAYAAFAAMAGRHRVVCLGDSITYGYPGGPRSSWVAGASGLTGISLVNQGMNGDSTCGMLNRLKHEILPGAPAYLLLQGGANDVLLGYSENETRHNIEAMLALALQAGICPVLIVPPPVIPVDGFVPADLARQMGEVMASTGRWVRAFAEKELLPVLDFYTVLLDPQTGRGDPRYFVDGCHPNRQGYRELAGAAGELLLRLKRGLSSEI